MKKISFVEVALVGANAIFAGAIMGVTSPLCVMVELNYGRLLWQTIISTTICVIFSFFVGPLPVMIISYERKIKFVLVVGFITVIVANIIAVSISLATTNYMWK